MSRFLVAVALPYAAIEALELHRTGLMDLRRLTGRSPGTLGAALMAGAAGLPLVLGLLLYAASVRAGTAVAPLTMLAILSVSAAVALVLLVVPALSKPNRWIVVTFIVLAAGTACALVNDSRPYALTAIGVSTTLVIATSHRAGQWFRRPPRAGIHPWRNRRPAVNLSTTRFAEFARLRLMTRIPGAWLILCLAAVAAAMTANLRWSSDYTSEMFSLMIVFVPLIVGAYGTSERARVERASGGLDRLKLTGEGAENATLQMVVAAALPFIVISAAAGGTLAVLKPGDLPAVMTAWPFAVVIWMFAGAAEGFRGRKPGAYLAIAVVLVGTLVPSRGGSWFPLYVATALAGPLAFGSMKGTGDSPFPGWRAMLVAPLLTLIVVALSRDQSDTAPILTTGLLSVGAGIMLPDRRPLRPAIIAGVAAAVAIAAAVATHAWSPQWAGFSPRAEMHVFQTRTFFTSAHGSRGTLIALIAASAALGWVYGCLAHREFGATPARSGVARAAPLALTLLLPGHSLDTFEANRQFMASTGHDGFAVAQILLLAMMAGITTVLARRAWRAPTEAPTQ